MVEAGGTYTYESIGINCYSDYSCFIYREIPRYEISHESMDFPWINRRGLYNLFSINLEESLKLSEEN